MLLEKKCSDCVHMVADMCASKVRWEHFEVMYNNLGWNMNNNPAFHILTRTQTCINLPKHDCKWFKNKSPSLLDIINDIPD